MSGNRRFLFVVSAFVAMGVAACNSDSGLRPTDADLAKGGIPGPPPPDQIAANPQYQNSTYSVANSGFTLRHAFKQVGLGNFSSVDYNFTADFEAVYDCKNKGGQIMPESSPFHADLSVEENTSIPPSNGQVTATLQLVANPFEDDTFGCPGDSPASKNFSWKLRPETVRWTNIKFCWGQTEGVEMQGPVPNGVGSNTVMTSTSGNITGSPQDGDSGAGTGIFSTPCLKA
jgi:hypothetical protein